MRCRAWARRQRSMRAWSPLRSVSGTAHPRNVGRPGVLRLLEQARRAEALGDRADVVAHRPGQQPDDRFDHQAGGDLSPAEHDIADAELAVDQVLAHPVVDALVAPAQQAEAVERGQLAGPWPGRSDARRDRAGTAAAADRRPRPTRTPARPHHHPGAAAERGVVDGAVHVGGVLAEVVGAQVEQTGSRALPSRLSAQNASTSAGKMVNTSICTVCKPTSDDLSHHRCRHVGTLAAAGLPHRLDARRRPGRGGLHPLQHRRTMAGRDRAVLPRRIRPRPAAHRRTVPDLARSCTNSCQAHPNRSPTSTARSTSSLSSTAEPLTSAGTQTDRPAPDHDDRELAYRGPQLL